MNFDETEFFFTLASKNLVGPGHPRPSACHCVRSFYFYHVMWSIIYPLLLHNLLTFWNYIIMALIVVTSVTVLQRSQSMIDLCIYIAPFESLKVNTTYLSEKS